MSEAQTWGAPASAPRRWGVREAAAAVGIAAVIAGLGGAAIHAATDTGSAAVASRPQQAFGQGGPAGMGGPGAAPLHGEFVAADGNGTYTAHLTQRGRVTAVSPTSITVRSDDDFTQWYLVPANANVSSIAVDDQVSIEATRDGQTATVSRITPNR